MKIKMISLVVLVICGIFYVSGCASHKSQSSALTEEKVISTSGKKPGWVSDPNDKIEKGDQFLFRGRVEKVPDATIGIRQAEAEAIKMVAEYIRRELASEFTTAAVADPTGAGFFTEDVIASVTGKVTVSGASRTESYYEKKMDAATEDRFYTCHALVQISKKDYTLARQRATEGLVERARTAKNQKAEEAAKSVKEKLEKEIREER